MFPDAPYRTQANWQMREHETMLAVWNSSNMYCQHLSYRHQESIFDLSSSIRFGPFHVDKEDVLVWAIQLLSSQALYKN